VGAQMWALRQIFLSFTFSFTVSLSVLGHRVL